MGCGDESCDHWQPPKSPTLFPWCLWYCISHKKWPPICFLTTRSAPITLNNLLPWRLLPQNNVSVYRSLAFVANNTALCVSREVMIMEAGTKKKVSPIKYQWQFHTHHSSHLPIHSEVMIWTVLHTATHFNPLHVDMRGYYRDASLLWIIWL